MSAARASVHVGILAFDGCLSSAVAGVMDTLRIANECARSILPPGAPAEVFRVAVIAESRAAVRASWGFSIPVSTTLTEARVDIAVVPPIAGSIREGLAQNPGLIAWLARPRAAVIASVCTGAFFLAEARLLGGQRATLNPVFADAFREAYRDVELVPQQRLTDDGRILCAGSATASLDLGVYLVERFVDHEVAVLTAKTLCLDRNHRSQLPYFVYIAPKDHGDPAVLGVQTWMEANYPKAISAVQLARRAGMSQRTFNRRFFTATRLVPIEYLHRLRIEGAKRLLETSDLSIEQVTNRVGYEDARSFSRLFRSHVGAAPGEYRNRFGTRSAAALRRERRETR